ncbi:MAG: hypothetical protein ABJP34_05040 [Erythrobacter sp.]
MTAVNSQDNGSVARVRTGVGMAGIFVVACFGAAMFFTVEQTQAAESLAGAASSPTQIAQVAEAE